MSRATLEIPEHGQPADGQVPVGTYANPPHSQGRRRPINAAINTPLRMRSIPDTRPKFATEKLTRIIQADTVMQYDNQPNHRMQAIVC